jgi:hypothetical protein
VSNIDKKTRLRILAGEGVLDILQYLQERTESSINDIKEVFSDYFDKDYVLQLINELDRIWFIQRLRNRVRITEDGIEACLLAKVINGASLHSVLDQLSLTTRRRFSLLTRDLTGVFFRDLSSQRNPTDILLCSPWIRLDKIQRQILLRALRGQKGLRSRCAVITRPPPPLSEDVRSAIWRHQLIDTLKWLVKTKIDTAVHPRLHTKLFIFDGPNAIAILGSENLTGAENIELGIRITDELFVQKLITYWEDTYSSSTPISLGDIDESKS